MILNINPAQVAGLNDYEIYVLRRLLNIYMNHAAANQKKDKYYEGKVYLRDVNLGIAIPDGLKGFEICCSWGAKAVDVLAARSMFDGFVGLQGEDVEVLDQLVVNNNLVAEYNKGVRDELKYGCTFVTLSRDPQIGCRIRFHSPMTAAAEWDGDKGRISYGFAIIDTAPDNEDELCWTPSVINLYTDYAVLVLSRSGTVWSATRYPHKMGRPLMEPLIWNATSSKPFGQSRLKEPIRRLIQGYVRTMANATIGLEFSTSPQKYLLGVTDEQLDAVVGQKFKQYVGSILVSTPNPETGEKPTFGQLPQGSIEPQNSYIRTLATSFSASTGLPVTETGVVNDANPTSSDAIEAQTKTLVGLAQDLNTGNGDALRTIALMALAIMEYKAVEDLDDDQRAVVAHFKNPAMPSIAATADAALKIATVRQGFAGTDTFLEMIGFDKADIRRIKAQEALGRGRETLTELGI